LSRDDLDFEEVELRAGAGNGAVGFFHRLDDCWRLTCHKIVWTDQDMFVAAKFGLDMHDALRKTSPELDTIMSVSWLHTGGSSRLQVYSRSVPGATTIVCDSVFELMTRSNITWIHMAINVLPSVSTNALSRFWGNPRSSSGGTIRFGGVRHSLQIFSPDHLRGCLHVLEVSTGPLDRIELRCEAPLSPSQTEALANFLQRCRCAIALKCSLFPVPSLILDALRGDCNIVELSLDNGVPDIDGLVRVLVDNKSLVRLSFHIRISDDNWKLLCQSLSIHPKLEFLRLNGPNRRTNESKTRRTKIS
jgi:hypothetical protein